MTLFELIFILLFLGSVVALALSAFLKIRGDSRKILLTVAVLWCVYMVILAVSDVFNPQKVFRVGEEQCFDEMCFAVVGLQVMPVQMPRPPSTSGSSVYLIKVRVTSHSLGRAQAEGGIRGRLYKEGAYMDVSESAQKAYDAQHGESPRLTQKIDPGESILVALVFEVPQKTEQPALVLDHGFTPGYFVIGESPFFHKPDVHQLPKDQ